MAVAANIATNACKIFNPQPWRPDRCLECFQLKRDHSSAALQTCTSDSSSEDSGNRQGGELSGHESSRHGESALTNRPDRRARSLNKGALAVERSSNGLEGRKRYSQPLERHSAGGADIDATRDVQGADIGTPRDVQVACAAAAVTSLQQCRPHSDYGSLLRTWQKHGQSQPPTHHLSQVYSDKRSTSCTKQISRHHPSPQKCDTTVTGACSESRKSDTTAIFDAVDYPLPRGDEEQNCLQKGDNDFLKSTVSLKNDKNFYHKGISDIAGVKRNQTSVQLRMSKYLLAATEHYQASTKQCGITNMSTDEAALKQDILAAAAGQSACNSSSSSKLNAVQCHNGYQEKQVHTNANSSTSPSGSQRDKAFPKELTQHCPHQEADEVETDDSNFSLTAPKQNHKRFDNIQQRGAHAVAAHTNQKGNVFQSRSAMLMWQGQQLSVGDGTEGAPNRFAATPCHSKNPLNHLVKLSQTKVDKPVSFPQLPKQSSSSSSQTYIPGKGVLGQTDTAETNSERDEKNYNLMDKAPQHSAHSKPGLPPKPPKRSSSLTLDLLVERPTTLHLSSSSSEKSHSSADVSEDLMLLLPRRPVAKPRKKTPSPRSRSPSFQTTPLIAPAKNQPGRVSEDKHPQRLIPGHPAYSSLPNGKPAPPPTLPKPQKRTPPPRSPPTQFQSFGADKSFVATNFPSKFSASDGSFSPTWSTGTANGIHSQNGFQKGELEEDFPASHLSKALERDSPSNSLPLSNGITDVTTLVEVRHVTTGSQYARPSSCTAEQPISTVCHEPLPEHRNANSSVIKASDLERHKDDGGLENCMTDQVHQWMLRQIATHSMRIPRETMNLIQLQLFCKNVLCLPEYDTLMNETNTATRISLLIRYLSIKDFRVFREIADVLEEQRKLPDLVKNLRRERWDIQQEVARSSQQRWVGQSNVSCHYCTFCPTPAQPMAHCLPEHLMSDVRLRVELGHLIHHLAAELSKPKHHACEPSYGLSTYRRLLLLLNHKDVSLIECPYKLLLHLHFRRTPPNIGLENLDEWKSRFQHISLHRAALLVECFFAQVVERAYEHSPAGPGMSILRVKMECDHHKFSGSDAKQTRSRLARMANVDPGSICFVCGHVGCVIICFGMSLRAARRLQCLALLRDEQFADMRISSIQVNDEEPIYISTRHLFCLEVLQQPHTAHDEEFLSVDDLDVSNYRGLLVRRSRTFNKPYPPLPQLNNATKEMSMRRSMSCIDLLLSQSQDIDLSNKNTAATPDPCSPAAEKTTATAGPFSVAAEKTTATQDPCPAEAKTSTVTITQDLSTSNSEVKGYAAKTVTVETLIKSHSADSTVLAEHRVILCGPGGSGKSSLKRSLLGEEFEANSNSTLSMELDCAYLRAEASGQWRWRRVKNARDQSKYRTAFTLMKTAKENLGGGDFIIDISPDQRPTSPTGGSGFFSTTKAKVANFTSQVQTFFLSAGKAIHGIAHFIMDAAQSSNTAITETITNKELLEDVEMAEDMCFMSLWDLAGQESLSVVMQPLLSSVRCIYCVVYDVSLDLDAEADLTFREGGRVYSEDRSSITQETNLDNIVSWLDVLHHVAAKRDSLKRIVYLVGCKADKLPVPQHERDSYLATVEQKIERRIKGKPYEHDIANHLFVDNTLSCKGPEVPYIRKRRHFSFSRKPNLVQRRSADPSVQQLQNSLVKDMQEHPSTKMRVPLRWNAFPYSLDDLFKKIRLPVVPLQVVEQLAMKACDVSDSEEVHRLISFYHGLGHLLHFNNNQHLEGKVVINIQWLVRVMGALFAPPKARLRTNRMMVEQYKLLHDRSILKEELALHIWKTHLPQEYARHVEQQRTFLFDLMEEHALLVRVGERQAGQDMPRNGSFWVPAMAGKEDEHHGTNELVSVYLHCLNGAQLPRILFWKLVARCIKRYQQTSNGPERQPKLYRSSAKLWVDHNYCLLLRRYHSGLHVTMLYAGNHLETADPRTSCHAVLECIECNLEALKKDSFDSLQWELSARCVCDDNANVCSTHSRGYICTPSECYHLASLERSCCPVQSGLPVDLSKAAKLWRDKLLRKHQLSNSAWLESLKLSRGIDSDEKALLKVFVGVSQYFTHTYICTSLATYLEERDDLVEEIQRIQPDIRNDYPAIANGILKSWNKEIAPAAGWSVEARLSRLQDVLARDLGRPDLATKCSNLWQTYKPREP